MSIVLIIGPRAEVDPGHACASDPRLFVVAVRLNREVTGDSDQ
jgi:hypothetical protein